jgi:hypothetical protein
MPLPTPRLAALLACLGAATSLGGAPSPDDDCEIVPGPHDVVKRKGDVVIEAGRRVEDVIVLQGSVTLRRGAEAKSVIALKGDVVIEAGATVKDLALAMRGKVKADAKATVRRRLELGPDGVHLVGTDGDAFDLGLKWNGQPVGEAVAAAALAKARTCRVVEQE